MCELDKALYGHPDSGGHWEKHLTTAIKTVGGQPMPDHPSTFWMKSTRLILTVYVDDLLLSGPCEFHEEFWLNLISHVNLEPAELLDRFLGRTHIITNV